MKRLWIILLIALAAAGAGYWWTHRGSSSETSYQTDKVSRGDVQELIPATGTLEPVDSVDVGAQIAGQILTFGDDKNNPGKSVDFRTEVEKDDILATIDPALYLADKQQADASLASANANLAVAQANLEQYQAKLTQAQNDWTRAQTLGPGEALAKTTYDNYQAVYLTAKAQVDLGTAAITQAEAAISQAKANVFRADRNLNYCTIKSPVKGTIIDRRVNIGQTVVSSLNAPSLFLIGTDMSKMQIWVSVNEADIPRIHPGMPVLFTVEGVNREFIGAVGKVRWNATMTQNVVTYTVEVNCDNPDNLLIPYRTANVKFLANEQKDVLLVPNAALRWRPRDADNNPTPVAAATGGTGSGAATGGTGRGNRGNRAASANGTPTKPGTVYVLVNGQPKMTPVQLGITDDVFTAVTGGDLKDGDEIITGVASTEEASSGGTTNPFAPTFGRGNRGGGGGGGGGGGRRGGG